jgi:hypothetical protein
MIFLVTLPVVICLDWMFLGSWYPDQRLEEVYPNNESARGSVQNQNGSTEYTHCKGATASESEFWRMNPGLLLRVSFHGSRRS